MDKRCLICAAKEPRALKYDQFSPCTFDPSPMELKRELERTNQEIERLSGLIRSLPKTTGEIVCAIDPDCGEWYTASNDIYATLFRRREHAEAHAALWRERQKMEDR